MYGERYSYRLYFEACVATTILPILYIVSELLINDMSWLFLKEDFQKEKDLTPLEETKRKVELHSISRPGGFASEAVSLLFDSFPRSPLRIASARSVCYIDIRRAGAEKSESFEFNMT
jgi:hypothetical protein